MKDKNVNLLSITRTLAQEVDAMTFGGKVTCVYNPLDYARAPHELFLRRYGHFGPDEGILPPPPTGRWLMLGMNPGPWGMTQTGVPYGEIAAVRDWMKIEAPVLQPDIVHPKRPITGFATTRSEVSGRRLWGWARDRYQSPDIFFRKFWMHNAVPLVFMGESGVNITPNKLPKHEQEPLFDAGDRALRAVVDLIQPCGIIGIGAFATKRAKHALKGYGLPIVRILHPSPASPKANQGWVEFAEQELRDGGVEL